MKFQYVGYGDDPPQEIVFMGELKFELDGDYVEVFDKFLIRKLKGNPSFKEVRAKRRDCNTGNS